MGLMRFIVQDRERIPPGGLEHVHMCGPDDLPWFSRAYFSGDQLVIERNEDDSGRVFVPWQVGDLGPLLISTSTLMEREEPYLLEVELARGMLNNLRNQIAQWEMMGLVIPQTLRGKIAEATSDFSRGASGQDDVPEAAKYAEHSIHATISAMRELTTEYVKQAFAMRRAQERQFTSWFGVHLGSHLPKSNVARQVVST